MKAVRQGLSFIRTKKNKNDDETNLDDADEVSNQVQEENVVTQPEPSAPAVVSPEPAKLTGAERKARARKAVEERKRKAAEKLAAKGGKEVPKAKEAPNADEDRRQLARLRLLEEERKREQEERELLEKEEAEMKELEAALQKEEEEAKKLADEYNKVVVETVDSADPSEEETKPASPEVAVEPSEEENTGDAEKAAVEDAFEALLRQQQETEAAKAEGIGGNPYGSGDTDPQDILNNLVDISDDDDKVDFVGDVDNEDINLDSILGPTKADKSPATVKKPIISKEPKPKPNRVVPNRIQPKPKPDNPKPKPNAKPKPDHVVPNRIQPKPKPKPNERNPPKPKPGYKIVNGKQVRVSTWEAKKQSKPKEVEKFESRPMTITNMPPKPKEIIFQKRPQASPKAYPISSSISVDSLDSQCTFNSMPPSPYLQDLPPGTPTCSNKYIPNLHNHMAGCQVCLFKLSVTEREAYERKGRHLRVVMTKGGCQGCHVFPSGEGEDPVRICRQCFFDTHLQYVPKRTTFGGGESLAGLKNDKSNYDPDNHRYIRGLPVDYQSPPPKRSVRFA